MDPAPSQRTLLHLTRTDPDPRVRHRADALLLVADGQALATVARSIHTSPGRLRAWRTRFVTEGRNG